MKHSHRSKLQKSLHVMWLFAIATQVLWMLALYSGWVVNSGVLDTYLDFMGASGDISSTSYELPSIVAQPLVVIIVMSIIIIIGLIMARMPKTAAQVTVRATTGATKSIEPIVRHVMPKKAIQQNQRYITSFTQVILSTLVGIATIPMTEVTDGVDVSVIWIITISLWALTVVLVMGQMIARRMSRSS